MRRTRRSRYWTAALYRTTAWYWTAALPIISVAVSANSVSAQTSEKSAAAQVTELVLINSDTNQPIRTLRDGETLNLARLPTRHLNISANTNDAPIAHVDFQLDDNRNYRSESSAPFALAGDLGGRYRSWTPKLGLHRVVATPYVAGRAGNSLALNLNVIDDAAAPIESPVESAARPAATPLQVEIARPRADSAPLKSDSDADPALAVAAEATRTHETSASENIFVKLESTNERGAIAATGRCVVFFDHQNTRLTVGCSHPFSSVLSAELVGGRDLAHAQPLCSLGAGKTPTIGDCPITPAIIRALDSGELYFRIVSGLNPRDALAGAVRHGAPSETQTVPPLASVEHSSVSGLR